MTPDTFRQLALSLPEAAERAHHGHPDFRVRRRIFATLGWPAEGWAMVKLAPEEQALRVEAEPTTFRPVPGNWGKQGATNVLLAIADEGSVRSALLSAWRRAAPKRLQGIVPER